MNNIESIWARYDSDNRYNRLEGDIKTDVAIIGGGIAGVLTAYMLKESGIDCILLESDRILSKTTANTTAKLTLQHGLIYSDLISRFGVDKAKLYLEAQRYALGEYSRLSEGIECDLEVKSSYVYSLSDRKKLEREQRALEMLGQSSELTDTDELPFKTEGAVCISNQAQFHPLKFLYALAKDLPIYENSKVTELGQGIAKCEKGSVKADRIVIATHFPILNKHGLYFAKMYQHRSYVIALEGAKDVHGMYVDECNSGMSFRNYGEYLLVGGGGHRTGKKGGGWHELESFKEKYYRGAEIKAKWAAQDCMTLDGMPYIGRYSRSTNGLYVATGFNKWGMTGAMLSAMLLRDELMGKRSRFHDLFSPSRSMLHAQLAVNMFESVIGILTPKPPRCPHLGCSLKYNSAEHSWDCPCHGSRFAEDGRLLDGPATDDKKDLPHQSKN